MIYVAAFALALAFLFGGAPALIAVLWWLALAFVVVCGLFVAAVVAIVTVAATS
jgi:hypothetical protein